MHKLLHRLLLAAAILALSGTGRAVAENQPAEPAPVWIVGLSWPDTRRVPEEQAQTINRYETDLAIALAHSQGHRVEFRLAPLDVVLRELAEGKIDFSPGLARTPERLGRLDFTVPHSRLNTNIFVRRGGARIDGVHDLAGRRIIVVRDSYSQAWAERQGYGPNLLPTPDITTALRKLATGDGDCLLAKQINIYAALRDLGIDNVVNTHILLPELQQELCAATRAGNREMLAQLNEALFTLKQTGELDRIYEKWMGLTERSGSAWTPWLRYAALATGALLVLVLATWAISRVQTRRAHARLAEIEQRVAARTEELAAAKARFEAVIAATPAGILLIDPLDPEVPGRIIECNEMTCRLHGYTREELIGQPFDLLRIHPFGREKLAAIARELTQRPRDGQTQHRHKDGTVLEIEFHSTMVRIDGRQLMLAVDHDITDRLRAEAALRRTEEFQRLVLLATNDGIFEWDIAADRFYLSERGCAMLGFAETELTGRRLGWWQQLHPDDREEAEAALWRHIIEGEPFVHTARYLHKDGSVRWLYCRAHTLRDDTGQPVRMVGSYTDVTELKRIDEELQLTRRLRAIGELVGGIAHEFNNLLTPILLQTSILSDEKVPPAELAGNLRPVLEAARRAQALTQRLLQFGRRADAGLETTSLARTIENTLALTRSTIDRRIEIVENLDATLPPLRINPATFGQAVMNLVLNARDALLDKLQTARPGWHARLEVTLARHEGAPHLPGINPATAPQTWQRLTVSDNGPGIAAEIRDRIFEPFFTTKDVGRGTGLGLAMVWNTIQELGGFIEVKSTVYVGTEFIIYLPDTSPTTPGLENTGNGPAVSTTSGPHRFLLVEDDQLVGETVVSLLRRTGNEVVWVREGETAFDRVLSRPNHWDAVITDLNMPGLGGEDLVDRLRASGYKGEIIVISGYITDQASARLRAAGVWAMLPKPFDARQLLSLIDEMVSTRRA